MYDINDLRLRAILDTFGGNGQDAPNPSIFNPPAMPDPSQGQDMYSGLLPSQTQPPIQVDPNDLANPIFKSTAKSMYTPTFKTDAEDKFNALLANYPAHQRPSLARTIIASMAGFKGGPEVANKIMDEPHERDITDWKNQAAPMYQAANLERQGNINERQLAAMQNATQINQQKADDVRQKNDEANQIAQKKNELLQEKQDGASFNFKGANVIVTRHDGTVYDSGVPSTAFDPMVRAALEARTKIQVEGMKDASNQAVAGINSAVKGVYNVPDPNDPTKQVSIRFNPVTKVWEPATLNGQQIGAVTKPGTNATGPGGEKLTQTTLNMMQGAQMLAPHIPELRASAADLEKRNLFGPVMSRVRELAANIGTTGNSADIQKSVEDFTTALQTDPQLAQYSDDRAVGNFISSLGLMASGAARVHSRGGASAQTIVYMKSLLGANSSLAMFNGRMDGLESYIKGYAAGPKQSAAPTNAAPKVNLTPEQLWEKYGGGKP